MYIPFSTLPRLPRPSAAPTTGWGCKPRAGPRYPSFYDLWKNAIMPPTRSQKPTSFCPSAHRHRRTYPALRYVWMPTLDAGDYIALTTTCDTLPRAPHVHTPRPHRGAGVPVTTAIALTAPQQPRRPGRATALGGPCPCPRNMTWPKAAAHHRPMRMPSLASPAERAPSPTRSAPYRGTRTRGRRVRAGKLVSSGLLSVQVLRLG